MIVTLSADHAPVLRDLDRLDRVHAESGVSLDRVRWSDLCRLGPDDEHVWLDVAAARTIGVEWSDAPSFGDDFDAMIEFARGRGWLDDTGSSVRAHVERVG